jgi:metal-sulfur cluster biosynthetic enzyme
MVAPAELSSLTQEERVARLWAALAEVEDPEFPMSIVDMGLVIEVSQIGQTAQVKMTFTSMGCPCMDMIMEDIRTRLLQEPEIEQVAIQVVWAPVWTKSRLSERGKEIMWLNGVSL